MTTTTIRKSNLNTYRIAFPLESGNLDVVEEFCVANDDAANVYAEENYADLMWYHCVDNSLSDSMPIVLNSAGKNINDN